jgi:hypothetical protein
MSAQPSGAANQASVESLRSPQQLAVRQQEPDQAVNMFSARGFALSQRIAMAFSKSTAVPAQFREFNEKRGPGGVVQWIENPAALGNCLVAIEVAQAVGMSITAVMQNADMIEGKLRWSAKFIIAAINASGRFTPLEFDLKNAGRIKAKYKEKLGWNDQKRGFDFREVEVEVDNWECRAWAMVMQNGRPTDKRVQSAKVSMKMAVEEGWYGKSGSKWQTEMYEQMLMYRAGSFFGNIHAPDIVMGMGRTREEVEDMTTIDMTRDGQVASITVGPVERTGPVPEAQVVSQVNTTGSEDHRPEGAEVDKQSTPTANIAGAAAATQEILDQMVDDVLTYAKVADMLVKASTAIEIDAARAEIPKVEDAMQQAELNAMATKRTAEIAPAAAAKTTTRRTGTSKPSVE